MGSLKMNSESLDDRIIHAINTLDRPTHGKIVEHLSITRSQLSHAMAGLMDSGKVMRPTKWAPYLCTNKNELTKIINNAFSIGKTNDKQRIRKTI